MIHMAAPGPTWIGPFEPRPASAAEVSHLAQLLNDAGMETRPLADARSAQWTKLLFNCATNPVCALTGLTHGGLCAHAPSRSVAGELLREGKAVAAALGIELDGEPEAMVDDGARLNPHHRPSMLQDVIAHRATEIAALNAGIVDAGRSVGVPTPLHETIVDLIRGLERSWS